MEKLHFFFFTFLTTITGMYRKLKILGLFMTSTVTKKRDHLLKFDASHACNELKSSTKCGKIRVST